MANEAVLVFELQSPIPMTVDNNVGIEKGAILALDDPMTASGVVGDSAIVAGIAASEKIAGDGKTKLGVYREGIFKVTLSGSCSAGEALKTDTSINHVALFMTSVSGVRIIGTALQTEAAAAAGKTILMELNPTAGAVIV